MRTRIWAVLVLSTVTLMAACGTGSNNSVISAKGTTTTTTPMITTVPTFGTDSTVASPATDRVAATTSTTKAHTVVTTGGTKTVNVTDGADGSSYTLHRGDKLHVVLNTTFWMVQAVSDAAVLTQQGAPVVTQTRPCVPGGGCGTTAATFTAAAAGQSRVVATRTSCGEAMGCAGTSGHFGVTITVI